MFPKLVLVSDDDDTLVPPVAMAAGERREKWLQDLVFRHPSVLPVAEIDQIFAEPVAICTELVLAPSRARIDALFVNKSGAITVVECKLWRNPEARREVVGQILDYAKELSRYRYGELQQAVSRATGRKGNVLHELVAKRYPDLDEATFVDAVAGNLRRGRFLLLVVGDGIHHGTEAIFEFLQAHSSLHLSFGLVEVAGFQLADGRLLVQPRILARTVSIPRPVIRVLDAQGVEMEIGDDTEPAVVRRPVVPAFLEADRAFWAELIATIRFDDPSQPPPVRFGVGNIRYDLGVAGVKLSAYRSRPGSIMATYIKFEGEAALRMFAEFVLLKKEIEAALRVDPESWVVWGNNTPDDGWVAHKSPHFLLWYYLGTLFHDSE